jgi:hypothetical protein
MQQGRSLGVLRNVLTAVGLLLLIVFGIRAASQARDMQLAGSMRPSIFAVSSPLQLAMNLGFAAEQMLTSEPAPSPAPKTIPTPLATPSASADAAPQSSSESSSDHQTGLERAGEVSSSASSLNDGVRVTPNGKKIIPAPVRQTVNDARSTINDIGKAVDDTSNQFVRLLP